MKSLTHHRRSIRLPGYDYTQPGAYFVTITTFQRKCIFGEIMDGVMRLNNLGTIVSEEWLKTGQIRLRIHLDTFVVMPNHLHGIIVIQDIDTLHRNGRGTSLRAPKPPPTLNPANIERFGKPTSDSIPTIIRLFKSVTTKRINQLRANPGAPVWQRNYYEHIIRNDQEWTQIRDYIETNPASWAQDEEYMKGTY